MEWFFFKYIFIQVCVVEVYVYENEKKEEGREGRNENNVLKRKDSGIKNEFFFL